MSFSVGARDRGHAHALQKGGPPSEIQETFGMLTVERRSRLHDIEFLVFCLSSRDIKYRVLFTFTVFNIQVKIVTEGVLSNRT